MSLATKYNKKNQIDWLKEDMNLLKLKEIAGKRLNLLNFDLMKNVEGKQGKRDVYVMQFAEMPDSFCFANDIIGEMLEEIENDGEKGEACNGKNPVTISVIHSKNGNDYCVMTFIEDEVVPF